MITKEQADLFVEKYETFYRKDLKINDTNVYLYNYLLADYETFQKEPLTRELRGLIFVEDECFISCPKFFNINEIPETLESKLKTKKIKKVLNKLDGSLITPIKINGDIVMKSKASFDSDQSKLAQQILDNDPDLQFAILDLFDNGFQPFFELTGMENQHVLCYEYEQRLTLIMVRDKEGHFIDIDKFKYDFIYIAENYDYSLEEMLEKQKTDKKVEGWVVKFTDETIIKIKTEEFFILHKISEKADSYKSILSLILDEDLDDVLSLVDSIRKEKILQIDKKVVNYVTHLVTFCFEETRSIKDRKDFAIKHNKHEMFSLLMGSIKKANKEQVKELVIKKLKTKYNKEKKAKEFIDSL